MYVEFFINCSGSELNRKPNDLLFGTDCTGGSGIEEV